MWRMRAGRVVEHGVFSLWWQSQGEAKPEDLELSFRELVSVILVLHRNTEWGEVKPRLEIDSSARKTHSPTLGSCVHGSC